MRWPCLPSACLCLLAVVQINDKIYFIMLAATTDNEREMEREREGGGEGEEQCLCLAVDIVGSCPPLARY